MRTERISVRLGIVIALEAACFVADLSIPHGYAEWLLYLLPLFLIWGTDVFSILTAASLATILEAVGFFFSPPGSATLLVSWTNRVAGVIAFWVFSLISISRLAYMEGLRREGDRFRRTVGMLDQVQDAVVRVDNEGRIQYMNQAAYRHYEIDQDEPVLGSTLGEFFRFEWQSPQQFEGYLHAMQAYGVWKGEKDHVTHKGKRFWGESVISLLKDAAGNPTGVAAVVRDITERRQAEVAIEESRERLRLANEAAGIGTWSLDPESGRLDWDVTTREHWGFSRGENLTFVKITDRAYHEDRPKLDTWIQAMRDQGIVSALELRIVHPTGAIRHMRATGRPLVKDGRVFRIIGTSLDISEQKKAEQSLRDYAGGLNFLSETALRMLEPLRSPDLFRLISERIYALADTAMVIFSEFDPRKRRTIVRVISCTDEEKAGIRRLLGRDPVGLELNFPEETRGRMVSGRLTLVEGGLCDMAFSQLTRPVCNAIEQALKIGDIFGMACSLEQDLLGTVSILTHGRGELRKKDLIESTVSQAALALKRRRTEEELRNERNFVDSILDTQGAVVAILDRNYRITRLNKAYEDIARCPPGSMVGREFWEMMDPADVENVKGQLADLARARNAEYENLICVRGGGSRYIRWRNSTIRNQEGEIEHIVATGIDITDRIEAERDIKRLNLALRRHTEELEHANRELESFSFSVTHDLRNPLGAVIGLGTILKEDYEQALGERGRNLIGRIVDSGYKMNRLIDDILNLSRVSLQEMHLEQIDLGAVARSVLAELERQHPNRGVATTVQQVPRISGDARLMHIALTNLLGNAWKYTSKTADPQIEFGCREENNEWVFFVRDNGAGFDMKDQDKLFVPFRRLHAERDYPGTGVGLATVARIIGRHGGRIWAQGEVGKGATFFFTLGR